MSETPEQQINAFRDLGIPIPEDVKIVDARPKEEIPEVQTEDASELEKLMGEVIPLAVSEQPAEDAVEMYALGHIVPLKRPFSTAGGNTVSEITFKYELDGAIMENMPLSPADFRWIHIMALIGACSGLPAKEVRKIKSCDLFVLSGVAMSFFANGPLLGD